MKQVCWGMAVSNFSLKLRWKCTENASEGPIYKNVLRCPIMVCSNIKKGGDGRGWEGTGGDHQNLGTKLKNVVGGNVFFKYF